MRSLLYSLLLVVASLPVLVYGQGKVYSPLVNIPGNGANGFEEYISFLYGASISVAALLAVVKIIIAGAKYMTSDVITNKGEALSDIQGAILGLLLILGAVIILEFINPQLIKRDIKFEPIAKRVDINARPSVQVASDGSVSITGVATNPDGTLKPGLLEPDGSYRKYAIDGRFMTSSGNVFVYDVAGFCEEKTKDSQNRQYDYNSCMASAGPGPFKDYCDYNYGNYGSAGTKKTCTLPTEKKELSYFKDAYTTYQQTHPEVKFVPFEQISVSVYTKLCKEYGTPLDKNGLGTGAESYICVKYN